MRKLGVTNRTQVAIACTSGAPKCALDDRSIKGKIDWCRAMIGVSLANGKA